MKYPNYSLSRARQRAGEYHFWVSRNDAPNFSTLLGSYLNVKREKDGRWSIYKHSVDFKVDPIVAGGFRTLDEATRRVKKILVARDVLLQRRRAAKK